MLDAGAARSSKAPSATLAAAAAPAAAARRSWQLQREMRRPAGGATVQWKRGGWDQMLIK